MPQQPTAPPTQLPVANPRAVPGNLDLFVQLFREGRWRELTRLADDLESLPWRAEAAARVGLAFVALGDSVAGRQKLAVAHDWGVSDSLVAELLALTLHETLGRAFLVSSALEGIGSAPCPIATQRLSTRALQHFQQAMLGLDEVAILNHCVHQASELEVPLAAQSLRTLLPTALREAQRGRDSTEHAGLRAATDQSDRALSDWIDLTGDGDGAIAAVVAAAKKMYPAIAESDVDLTELSLQETKVKIIHLKGDYIPGRIADEKRFYESNFLEILTRFHKPGATFVDVGANIGNHSLYFSLLVRATVIAIEPEPHNFACLSANVHLNKVAEIVRLENVAVGAANGITTLAMSISQNFGSFSARRAGHVDKVGLTDPMKVNVATTTLDGLLSKYLATHSVSIIKIDVEGMEFEVLSGAEKTLELSQPVIAVECSTWMDFSRIEGLLAQRGYFVVTVENATPTFIFVTRRNLSHMAALEEHLRAGALVRAHKKRGFS